MTGQPSQSSRATSTRSSDLGWKYVRPPEENNTNDIGCNFCGKVMKGGITRAKQHLMGKSGNVTKCLQEVKDELWEYFKQKKKQEKESEEV